MIIFFISFHFEILVLLLLYISDQGDNGPTT